MKADLESKSTLQLTHELGRHWGRLAAFRRRIRRFVISLFGPLPRKNHGNGAMANKSGRHLNPGP
jgi:hypothetical protein